MSTPTTCTTGDLFDTGATTSAPAPRPRRAPVTGHRGEGRRRPSSAPRPPAPPPSRSVVSLLGSAREGLREAQGAATPAERFRLAHLAALRSAAAVLAVRATARRSSRPTDAWTLLTSVAPEYGEWAAFFAAHSSTRSAVEAGATRLVGQRDADDMVRQADLFLALVTRTVAGLRPL